jgi:hypothetical protein
MTKDQARQRSEYFRNNLLPILVSQQHRKELAADKAKERVLL